MHNNTPYGFAPQELRFQDYQTSEWNSQQLTSTNSLIYGKHWMAQPVTGPQKVLVNPHFKASNKVFVNRNFAGTPYGSSIHVNPRHGICQVDHKLKVSSTPEIVQNTKIHVNPNIKNIQMPIFSNTVHINPKFANVAVTSVVKAPICNAKENVPVEKLTNLVVLTRTKLIRSNTSPKLKRRNSVKSKYKIVKTGLLPKKTTINRNKVNIGSRSRFKVDNRRKSLTVIGKQQRKYIYFNKLASLSDLAKSRVIKGSPLKSSFSDLVKSRIIKSSALKSIKHHSVININGVVYRKSRNSLRRASLSNITGSVNKADVQVPINDYSANRILKESSVYTRHKIVKKFKVIRKGSPNKSKQLSVKKLRKCNIPCPSFKKYGICKSRDNGKCILKHDPDQIALCTRFLQGACVKEKCLLSHNVSPEKMPTCKYYLEGSCSRENCPYLHVKISPKAEVCRDFLEGFCKKAAECDKRHQYLCPDYEKYGECAKQRCPYPHGKMVRTYLINRNTFAKKCSDLDIRDKKSVPNSGESKSSQNEAQTNDKRRYYAEEDDSGKSVDSNGQKLRNTQVTDEVLLKNVFGLQSRPKLGSLPSFIPFKNS